MKVVAFVGEPQTAADPGPFVEIEWPDPVPWRPHDLLVRVHAVSVNPRDLKSRKAFAASPDQPLVLGHDTSGIVEAVGPGVTLFRPGDAVVLCRRARPAGVECRAAAGRRADRWSQARDARPCSRGLRCVRHPSGSFHDLTVGARSISRGSACRRSRRWSRPWCRTTDRRRGTGRLRRHPEHPPNGKAGCP